MIKMLRRPLPIVGYGGGGVRGGIASLRGYKGGEGHFPAKGLGGYLFF
jgi:hypothetical protein